MAFTAIHQKDEAGELVPALDSFQYDRVRRVPPASPTSRETLLTQQLSMKITRYFALPLLATSMNGTLFAGTTWDGGGSDSNINTANNWNDNLNPTLTGGSSTLTFGTGGSTATINTNVNLAGIVLNRDANFEIANGAGSLTLGSSGITVNLPTTTGRSHTISESNLVLGASQSWTVNNNTGGASLTVSSVIDDGASTFAITKMGDGLLTLSGNNSFGASGSNGLILGTNLGSSPYTNTGGIIRLAHNNAAGLGRIAVYGGYQMGRLELTGGINVANRIELYGRQGPTYTAINNFSGNNTLSGDWNIVANGSSINIGSDSGKLTVSGNAATGATGRVLTFRGNGEVEFNKVVNTAVFDQVRTGGGTGLYWLTQDNTYTGATTISNTGSRIRITHANALGTTAGGTSVSSGAALEIQGGITTAAEALSLSGGGISNGGALRNISGDNTYTGAITLAAAARIHSDSGTLTLDVASGSAITSTDLGVTFGGAGDMHIKDGISLGTGSLTKEGLGTLTIDTTVSYTGATSVIDGTLAVKGNISTSITTVGTGATLAGNGTTGAVTIENGGTLAPGLSAGTLTISGNLGLNATSNLAFELDPSSTTIGLGVNDLVTGVSNLTLDGLLAVTATSGSFTGVTSGTWRLINYTGTLTNNGLTLSSMPSLDAGYNWNLDLSTTGQVNLSIVPEPAFVVMGGFGILGLLRRRRSC